MDIEIYDVLELDTQLVGEKDEESIKLINELGLEGQSKQVNENEERLPYQMVTEEQKQIMTALFSSYQKIQDYDKGPIPYRVLKEAKVAKDHFKYLYVIFDTPAEDKDPILVGKNSEFCSYYGPVRNYDDCFLIARWGEALESWGDLIKKAVERNKNTSIAKFRELMAHFDGIRNGIEKGHIRLNPDMKFQNIINDICGRENSLF